MPIPKSRAELVNEVEQSFTRLWDELETAGSRIGNLPCVDDWSVKDLLTVRTWWTERVVDWIQAGQRGESPVTPAEGYRWKETPRLNAAIVRQSRRESYRSVRNRLHEKYQRIEPTIDSLNDTELLTKGVFEWAGNYPISRWISINTTRQYLTARTFIRRAIRDQRSS